MQRSPVDLIATLILPSGKWFLFIQKSLTHKQQTQTRF